MGDDKKDKEGSGVIGNDTNYLSYIYENQIRLSPFISYSELLFNILQTLLINWSLFLFSLVGKLCWQNSL